MSETLFNISFEELCQHEGVDSQYVIEIVEYGIVLPLNSDQERDNVEQWIFDTHSIYWLKKALRLHQDLEVDWVAVAMVIKLMKQKEALKKQNEAYRQQLRRFIKADID